MRVLLIYPTIGGFFKPSFHAGIASISAVLKQNHHLVELFVLSSWADQSKMLKRIKDFNPGLIGFSATASTFPAVIQSSSMIKKMSKKINIICGGVHTTIFPQGLFEATSLDGICLGEGEYAMLDLVNSLEQGRNYLKIDGFWFRDSHRIIQNKKREVIKDLDLLPFPDREIFAKEKILFYKSQPFDSPDEKGLEFIFSRGCPFDCHYCSNHALRDFYGSGYIRRRSPPKAVQEIILAVKKYKPDYLQFHDDIFGLDKHWLNDFLHLYKKGGMNLPFNCNLRPGAFSKNEIMNLKKRNCRGVLIGLESGDTQIRRKILNRQITNQQIIKSFCLVRDAGLKTFAFCMMGFPGETPQKFMRTVELVGKIKPDSYNIQIFYPYPGTRLFKLCQEKGLFRKRVQENFIERKDTVLNLPLFKRKDILYYYKNFFKLVGLHQAEENWLKNIHRKIRLFLLSSPPSAFFFRLFQSLLRLDEKLRMNRSSYQKFIILTAPRSGSNYLSYLLHDHPQIMSMGEVYCSDTIWGQPGRSGINHHPYLKIFRDIFPVLFLKKIIFSVYPQKIKAAGFRFFYHHADHYPSVLQYLLSLKNLKIIHLQRVNLLENLISTRLAAKTQVWSSLGPPQKKTTRISLTAKDCQAYFKKMTAARERFKKLLAGFSVLNVDYEQLVTSPQEELAKILRFLNVPQRKLTCSLQKQNLRTPAEVIVNYDKLKKEFENTRWKQFFQ